MDEHVFACNCAYQWRSDNNWIGAVLEFCPSHAAAYEDDIRAIITDMADVADVADECEPEA